MSQDTVSERRMRYRAILQIMLWIVRSLLVVLVTYWVLLTILLIPPFLNRGMEGVHAKLMHVAMIGMPFGNKAPDKVASQVHHMWQAQFLLVAMTWAACSVPRG